MDPKCCPDNHQRCFPVSNKGVYSSVVWFFNFVITSSFRFLKIFKIPPSLRFFQFKNNITTGWFQVFQIFQRTRKEVAVEGSFLDWFFDLF